MQISVTLASKSMVCRISSFVGITLVVPDNVSTKWMLGFDVVLV